MRIESVLTVIAGLAVGAAAGAALLYLNPLTAVASPEIGAFDRVLRYDYPSDVLLVTHAGAAPLPTRPAGVQELWESSIRSIATGLVALRSEADAPPAAIASRIAVPSKRTDLLGTGVLVDDDWLLTVPGRGSLLVQGRSNVWPAIKENLLPVRLLGRPWVGPRSYRMTVGPAVRGTAVVVGATGRFAARQGSAVERFDLNEFSRDVGFESFTGELHLTLVPEEEKGTAGAAEHAQD